MIPERIVSAERILLAHVIEKNDASILHGFNEGDFSDPLHREVYRHVIEMWNGLRPININSILEQMRVSAAQEGNRSDEINSANFVARFGHSEYYPERVDPSKALLLEYAVSHEFLSTLQELTKDYPKAETGELIHALVQIDSAIRRAVTRINIEERVAPLQVALGEVVDDIQNLYDVRTSEPSDILRRTSKLKTGLDSLDELTGGLRRSSVAVALGHNDNCLTSLAINIALTNALEGKSVLFIKSNLGSRELARRILGCQSSIPLKRMEDANLDTDEWDQIASALGKLTSASFRLMGEKLDSFFEIDEQVQTMRRQYGEVDLIVVDDLSELVRTLKLSGPDIDAQYVLSKLCRLADYRGNSSDQGSCVLIVETIADVTASLGDELTPLKRELMRVGHQVIEIENDEQLDVNVAREISVSVIKNLFGGTGRVSFLYNPTRIKFESFRSINT